MENKEYGKKLDHGKEDWSLLPFSEVLEIVRVLDFGAKKYSRDNWMNVKDGRFRYFAAMMRHLVAWFSGEKDDKESGMPHLAHAGCCLLFLMWFDKNQKET